MTPEAENVWNACFPVPMETAVMLQQNTEQLGAYLVQMAQMMLRLQGRLDELEEKQKAVTAPADRCGRRRGGAPSGARLGKSLE